MNYFDSAQSSRSIIRFAIYLTIFGYCAEVGLAQQPVREQALPTSSDQDKGNSIVPAKSQEELVEGLLDLLKEPKNNKQSQEASSEPIVSPLSDTSPQRTVTPPATFPEAESTRSFNAQDSSGTRSNISSQPLQLA